MHDIYYFTGDFHTCANWCQSKVHMGKTSSTRYLWLLIFTTSCYCYRSRLTLLFHLLFLAVLDIVNKNNGKATSSDLSGLVISKRQLEVSRNIHPNTMYTTVATKVDDTSVFNRFRRVDDEEVKWILPRPTTSESESTSSGKHLEWPREGIECGTGSESPRWGARHTHH